MIRSVSKVIGLVVVSWALVGVQPYATAQPDEGAAEKKPASGKVLPFNGKVKAVDQDANTVHVGTRTFQITPDTKIVKGGKPATLADAEVGEVVGGAYRKSDDGKLITVSIRFGPKPDKEKKEL